MTARALFATRGETENLRRRNRSRQRQQFAGYRNRIVQIGYVGCFRYAATYTENNGVSHVRLRAGTHQTGIADCYGRYSSRLFLAEDEAHCRTAGEAYGEGIAMKTGDFRAHLPGDLLGGRMRFGLRNVSLNPAAENEPAFTDLLRAMGFLMLKLVNGGRNRLSSSLRLMVWG